MMKDKKLLKQYINYKLAIKNLVGQIVEQANKLMVLYL